MANLERKKAVTCLLGTRGGMENGWDVGNVLTLDCGTRTAVSIPEPCA